VSADNRGDGAAPAPYVAWARRIESIAATGLHYTENPYDAQRYEQLRDVAAEMFAQAAGGADAEKMRGQLAAQFGPGTPKIVVRAAVFRDAQILLVRESADGRWAMPGGWAEVNEPPARGVEREVFEETGYRVRAERLIYLYDPAAHRRDDCLVHVYTALFLCTLIGGEPATSIETTAVGFFAQDALPELSLTRNTDAQIGRAFAALHNPDAPASFD